MLKSYAFWFINLTFQANYLRIGAKNIVPIFKKGSKQDPNNYRPVSLTAVLCKVMKHIIIRYSNQVNVALEKYNHSCATQLLITTHPHTKLIFEPVHGSDGKLRRPIQNQNSLKKEMILA